MVRKSRKRNAQDAPSASHVPDTIEPTFDAIRFRSKAHQVHFFTMVQHRTPNVEIPFHFNTNEFPNITAEIERRGWTYLCNLPQGKMEITLLREFYANAKKTRRERASDPLYISHVRGKEIDFSPESIKVILQLPDVGVDGPSYEARKSSNDQRLDEVLRGICEDYAQWKLDSKGNSSQLKRRDLKPTAKGWFDFVRRSLMPTSNANEVTLDRAVLVHSIMEGLSIKAELLISNHISAVAESKDPNKRLPFTEHHQVQEEDDQEQQHQQEQYFQQQPPQQFNFPQQNFQQEFNWQELTRQFQGMRVKQNNQFQDFFDRQNTFFEDMRTHSNAYKQGIEDLKVQQHKYVDELKAGQEITNKAMLELKKN
ncbi:hypothetical protein PIB30_087767 [Stylosanthes scabra]|uniref:Putative plant transposon protein domain-containing protein n=1 Tax=Stylosanthes scabra TaxID=79078 RepID=A0ABU6ZS46_9FABA|nr:hypothetical protein [Stylosanthes scabra]